MSRTLASHDGNAADCSASAAIGTICSCNIMSLHPTQISVGMIEVKEKEKEIAKMKNVELEKFKSQNPEPSVIGPGGQLYIIDHHHLARALHDQGVHATYCQIEGNFSRLTPALFWRTMDQKKWVYPFDENGRGPLSYSVIPQNVSDLKDDPYRSLAGAVRQKGGYEKSDAPFAEFLWAEFFRSRIDPRQIEHHFDDAVKAAAHLAHSPEAANLPGYTRK